VNPVERQVVQIVKPLSRSASSVTGLSAMTAEMYVRPVVTLFVVLMSVTVASILIRPALPVVRNVRLVAHTTVTIISTSVLKMNTCTVRHIRERVLNVATYSAQHIRLRVHNVGKYSVRQIPLLALHVEIRDAIKMPWLVMDAAGTTVPKQLKYARYALGALRSNT
jgi:hypothetical protein